MGTILGVWDGHDSGAALVCDGRIVAAVNEERLTRRKLEVNFPARSIVEVLELGGVRAGEVEHVALSTYDLAKTLTRLVPSLKERYYRVRRRKELPGRWWEGKRRLKYWLTEQRGWTGLNQRLGGWSVRRRLAELGVVKAVLHWIEHHEAHAAAAALASGLEAAAVLTLDGVGDGLSGSVSDWDGRTLRRVVELPAADSLGIFFEQLTFRLNMRELEDEGKAMALACLARPVEDAQNPLLGLFYVDGLRIRARLSRSGLFRVLDETFWRYPSEQVAWMAQRLLEVRMAEWAERVAKELGREAVALSGGVFANVKANRAVRLAGGIRRCFVFPHMGDGGLALGAALALQLRLWPGMGVRLGGLYLGPSYTEGQMRAAVEAAGLRASATDDPARRAAELLCRGEPIGWFQGRMEYGPRALGARSILALPDNPAVRDLLNLRLKKRVWYQPYCPSLLAEEADSYFEDYDGVPNRDMTMAYMVRKPLRSKVQAVIAGDGSCRPQMVLDAGSEEGLYRRLLEELRRLRGTSLVLNTSFNIHGEPLVCSPEDAVRGFKEAGLAALVMGNLVVERE